MKKQPLVDLFLDSGAFSAFTQGVSINIDEYISFIKEHEDIITIYANLDVIGDPKGTLKNQRIMEKAGLNPLPCFHYGEPFEYLQFYLDQYDYIALGGMAADASRTALTSGKRAAWLDKVFGKFICIKEGGLPCCKVHGFGMTSLKLMIRYPWYSVDSTSWVITGRMGSIYIPIPWLTHLDEPWKITVSLRSPNQKEAGQHFTTLSPSHQQYVLGYLKKKGYRMGKSVFHQQPETYKLKKTERWHGKAIDGVRQVETVLERGVSNDYRLRDEMNILYFLDLEKALPEWPWSFKCRNQKGFGL